MSRISDLQNGIETGQSRQGARLHLPAAISYTCHNSGVCCTTFDTIPVDATRAEAIRGSIGSICGSMNRDNVETLVADGDALRIGRTAGTGACVFYGKDKLCAVHRVLGEAAKPQVCRDFPFRYIEAPDGVYVGLSFVCPSVRGNKGTPLVSQESMLQHHYAGAASIRNAPKEVSFGRNLTISWDDYLAFEAGIDELLGRSDLPLNVRLIAVCVLTGMLERAMHAELDAGKPAPLISDMMPAMQRSGFSDVIRIAQSRGADSRVGRRLLLGMFTSFANTLQNEHGRARTLAAVFMQYARAATTLGALTLRPIEKRVPLKVLDPACFPEAASAGEELLERYLRHCVFRKDLSLGETNVVRRVKLLAVNAALISWYAATEAFNAGREIPGDQDFSEAVGHVEKFYGFHSAFYRFFERNRLFSEIVDTFFAKPGFPFMLLADHRQK